jgi:hypothetical protein
MSRATIPFHYGLFSHAMIALLGREPDYKHCLGFDGFYLFRYEPRDDADKRNFSGYAETLREWLSVFDLVPLRSRCEYGRLVHPQSGQENRDYLEIRIVHVVEKSRN